MAKSSKTSNGKRFQSKTSKNGTNRMLKEGLTFASTLFESKKDLGSEKIAELASATQEFASSMKDIPVLEENIAYAGDKMENLADYINDNSLAEIISDASIYFKRYPYLAIASGATLGLIVILVVSRPSWTGLRMNRGVKQIKVSVRSMGASIRGSKSRASGSGANLH